MRIEKTHYRILATIILCILYVMCLYLFFNFYYYSLNYKLVRLFLLTLLINIVIFFIANKSLIVMTLMVIIGNFSFTIIMFLLFGDNSILSDMDIIDILGYFIFYFIGTLLDGNFLIPFILRNVKIILNKKR